MKIAILFLLYIGSLQANESINFENCDQAMVSENVYSDDFSWGMNLSEVINKEKEIYNSGKRLNARAYTRGGKIYFPLDGGEEAMISEQFVEAIAFQVEQAFSNKYVDALIFPDMGHSHFFIPMDVYNDEISPINDKKERVERMYSLPSLKVLYHTAEQLKMMDEDKNLINDQKLIWRYNTRNIIGGMNKETLEVAVNETGSYNTVHDYGAEGEYRYWGAGFNISGSKDGCFSYQRDGKTFYFDLSLKDLESKNSGNDWGF